MRKNSIKNTRINGEVQRELSQIIRGEIKDPRIALMTSVTGAEVAPDLKTCKVYISVLAKNLNLRNTPELSFVLDESIEYGVNMSKLIDTVREKEKGEEDA